MANKEDEMITLRHAFMLVPSVLFGCERVIPVTGSQMASAQMFELGDAIVALSKEEDVFHEARGRALLVAKLASAKILSAVEGDALMNDPWGKEIRIEYNKKDRIVILTSAGPNNRFENGDNDDVVAEIHIPVKGSPKIVRRYLGPSGRVTKVTINYERPAQK
jgi:hypothetical protein